MTEELLLQHIFRPTSFILSSGLLNNALQQHSYSCELSSKFFLLVLPPPCNPLLLSPHYSLQVLGALFWDVNQTTRVEFNWDCMEVNFTWSNANVHFYCWFNQWRLRCVVCLTSSLIIIRICFIYVKESADFYFSSENVFYYLTQEIDCCHNRRKSCFRPTSK